MNVPKKVGERILSVMKGLRPIIEQQKSRDVSEADTVTLVKDIVADVFGYDKYADITAEHAIRGTYCDICIKVGEKLSVIIEVKAIGIRLDDKHVKQSVDYAANEGVEWVILTNAQTWRLYRVVFAKPIDKHLVCEVDLLTMDYRKVADAECLYVFTKEALAKGVPQEVLDRQQATSRYMLAALLLHNESLRNTIRRELRRVVEVQVDPDEIQKILAEEVIKRDAMDGAAFAEASKRVNKREGRALRASPSPSQEPPAATVATEVIS